MREVTLSQGYVTLTFTDGSSSYQYLQDRDGSVARRIKESYIITTFVKVNGEDRYIDPKYARWVVCQQGGTNIGWANAGNQFIADNCALFEQIKASGN